MDKLYMLEVAEEEGLLRKPIAYSHSGKKLKKIAVGASWYAGTDDVTNSPEVIMYGKGYDQKGYPMYWIREVPFVI